LKCNKDKELVKDIPKCFTHGLTGGKRSDNDGGFGGGGMIGKSGGGGYTGGHECAT
jgi:hypothetical protein